MKAIIVNLQLLSIFNDILISDPFRSYMGGKLTIGMETK